jgi:hypothetical protein
MTWTACTTGRAAGRGEKVKRISRNILTIKIYLDILVSR